MNAPVRSVHAETFPYVDHLQELAERWRLVELLGQDAIQVIMAQPFRVQP